MRFLFDYHIAIFTIDFENTIFINKQLTKRAYCRIQGSNLKTIIIVCGNQTVLHQKTKKKQNFSKSSSTTKPNSSFTNLK